MKEIPGELILWAWFWPTEILIRQVNITGILREKPCHSFNTFNKWLNAFYVPPTVLDAVDLAVNPTDRIVFIKGFHFKSLQWSVAQKKLASWLLNCSDLNLHFTSHPTCRVTFQMLSSSETVCFRNLEIPLSFITTFLMLLSQRDWPLSNNWLYYQCLPDLFLFPTQSVFHFWSYGLFSHLYPWFPSTHASAASAHRNSHLYISDTIFILCYWIQGAESCWRISDIWKIWYHQKFMVVSLYWALGWPLNPFIYSWSLLSPSLFSFFSFLFWYQT